MAATTDRDLCSSLLRRSKDQPRLVPQ
jgi:hypothetical protein